MAATTVRNASRIESASWRPSRPRMRAAARRLCQAGRDAGSPGSAGGGATRAGAVALTGAPAGSRSRLRGGSSRRRRHRGGRGQPPVVRGAAAQLAGMPARELDHPVGAPARAARSWVISSVLRPIDSRCDRLADRLGAARVEVGRGLVEHRQRRVAQERPRDRDPLAAAPPTPAGRRRRSPCPARRGSSASSSPSPAARAASSMRSREASGSGERDVLRDRSRRTAVRAAAPTRVRACQSDGAISRRSTPPQRHGAARRVDEAQRERGKRALAGAAAAHHRHELARVDRQLDRRSGTSPGRPG